MRPTLDDVTASIKDADLNKDGRRIFNFIPLYQNEKITGAKCPDSSAAIFLRRHRLEPQYRSPAHPIARTAQLSITPFLYQLMKTNEHLKKRQRAENFLKCQTAAW